MQGSAGANRYAGEVFLRHLILAAVEQYPHIPVVMHRDHAPTPDICAQAIQSGFSSVMMDGSLLADMKTPASFGYNVEVTRSVVKMAHACGVSVEGEIGCLGSLENQPNTHHSQLLTDPDEAVEFVKQTQIDALAVAIGTSHGAYKFSKPPTGYQSFKRITTTPAQYPFCDARFQFSAARVAKNHQSIRRQNS
jgi:fructose-bisphosphate aldolase class II